MVHKNQVIKNSIDSRQELTDIVNKVLLGTPEYSIVIKP